MYIFLTGEIKIYLLVRDVMHYYNKLRLTGVLNLLQWLWILQM